MRVAKKKIEDNNIFENTNWMLAQNIYNMMLSLVISAVVARYLGTENYGILGYGASLVTLFSSVSSLGIDSILANELLLHNEKSGELLGTSLVLRFIASIISLICISIIVPLIEPNNALLYYVTIFQALSVVLQIYGILNIWFTSKLISKYYVSAAIAAATLSSVWKVISILTHKPVQFFAAAVLIESFCYLIIVVFIFIRVKNFKLSCSVRTAKFLLKKSGYYILVNISIVLYSQIDKIMLGKMIGDKDVGIYTAAVAMANMWIFIPDAIIQSARPAILTKKKVNESNYINAFQMLLLGITLFGGLVFIGYCVLGKFLVLMLYGKAFKSAVHLLPILVVASVFAILGTARSIWTVAEGFNKYSVYFTVVGAVVNFVLNYISIPIWGTMGAAGATAISQIVVFLISPLLFKDVKKIVFIYLKSVTKMKELLLMIKKIVKDRYIFYDKDKKDI